MICSLNCLFDKYILILISNHIRYENCKNYDTSSLPSHFDSLNLNTPQYDPDEPFGMLAEKADKEESDNKPLYLDIIEELLKTDKSTAEKVSTDLTKIVESNARAICNYNHYSKK